MKTLEQALNEIEEATTKKREETEREYSILNALPPDLIRREPRVFVYELYGRKATVTIKTTKENVPEILRLLPEPMNTVKACGTFTSFYTEEYSETVRDERVKSIEHIFPYFLKAEPNFSRVLKIEFFGRLPGFDGVLEFNIETPLHEWYKEFSLTPRFLSGQGSRNYDDKRIVESTEVRVGNDFYNIHSEDGQSMATWSRYITWARGEVHSTYMNDITGYWVSNVDPLPNARELFASWLSRLEA